MLFNDLGFLLVFLPAVLILFFAPAAARLRTVLLLVASIVFYGLSGIEHAIVLLGALAWVYVLTCTAAVVGNRWLTTLAVAGPALALLYYKYLGFLLGEALGLGPGAGAGFALFEDIALPAGISFFTFQLVAYALDRYRGAIPVPPPPLKFALYISFFPQLVAGPILRYHEVMEPLAGLHVFRLRRRDASAAIAYIGLGLAAKVLIADTLGNYIAPMAARPADLGVAASLYVLFAYSFEIYFDFYGYSLIAIGLGRLFGFHFPDNFDRPYAALNPRDFWRRWHRTLSYWIRDYLYLPLGGNRSYVRNIAIVFALCGLWHGAGWTFVVWGLYHGALVIAHHVAEPWWRRLPRLAQTGATFVLVSLGWILFQFDFAGAAAFLGSLAGAGAGLIGPPAPELWAGLAVAALACYVPRFEAMAERGPASPVASVARTAGYALLFLAVFLFVDRSQDFIYFRF